MPSQELTPRWLDVAFFASLGAVVVLTAVAIGKEIARPPMSSQRVVPALGLIDRCEACHDESTHRGEWTATHPPDRFGCTSCHGGQGYATRAADAHEVRPDWERPLFTAAEREANCGTCHREPLLAGAPSLVEGRRAMAERGCAGCHDLPGPDSLDIAPELDGLRDKVSAAWVRSWLTDPAATAPTHKMPRFELVPRQVEALTAFLFSLPGPELRAVPTELQGDSDRGKVAVARRRCATCHLVEGRGGSLGTSLDTAGAKIAPAWLFNYLTDTHRIHPRTRMPGFRISDDEAIDIVAYAGEQWVPDTAELPWRRFAGPPQVELAGEGKALFVELGCRGCHHVASVPLQRVGMAMATIADRHLADLPPGTADVPSWVARKTKEPHAFDLPGSPAAKMPAYAMDDAEARAVGIAVASMRTVRRPAEYLRGAREAEGTLPGGATGKLIGRFRCLVCHSVRGEGGTVARVPLDGEGSRVQRPWLETFLGSPVTLRMDQSERMPVLGIDEVGAKRLASWIETALTDPRIPDEPPATADEIQRGKQLFAERGCPTCHVAEGQGTMKGPVLDGARDRLQLGYVVAMMETGNGVVPERRHPDETVPHASARAIAGYVCSLELPESLRRATR